MKTEKTPEYNQKENEEWWKGLFIGVGLSWLTAILCMAALLVFGKD